MSSRRNKKRSLDLQQSGTISGFLDDQNQVAVHSAYLGTLAIDVRKLDTDTFKNRELDDEHVAELINSFKRGVRRFFKEARMRALMSQADFDHLLQSYESTGSSVHQARVQATNTDGGKLADFVHVKMWPEGVQLPSLIAGQHRQAALLAILEEQTKLAEGGGKTPEGSGCSSFRG